MRVLCFSFLDASLSQSDDLRDLDPGDADALFEELANALDPFALTCTYDDTRLYLATRSNACDADIRAHLETVYFHHLHVCFSEIDANGADVSLMQELIDRLPRMDASALQARIATPTWPPRDAPLRARPQRPVSGNARLLSFPATPKTRARPV